MHNGQVDLAIPGQGHQFFALPDGFDEGFFRQHMQVHQESLLDELVVGSEAGCDHNRIGFSQPRDVV